MCLLNMDYSNIRGFCDLNIDNKFNKNLLERIMKYNYRVIALNWTIDESMFEQNISKKKKKDESPEEDVVPVPFENFRKHTDFLANCSKPLKILKRLTVIISKPDQLKRVFNSKNLKKFDLLSALPKNQAAFQYVCGTNNVDIISFEVGLTEYKPVRKLYKQVVDRGGFFEISYAQALRSSVKRQETITMANFFHIYGKSKNIIISSGATHVLELRNPYDVANLALLFGLSEEMGKCAISNNCRNLILQVQGKKIGRTAITIEKVNKSAEEDDEPHRKKLKIDDNVSQLTNSISTMSPV